MILLTSLKWKTPLSGNMNVVRCSVLFSGGIHLANLPWTFCFDLYVWYINSCAHQPEAQILTFTMGAWCWLLAWWTWPDLLTRFALCLNHREYREHVKDLSCLSKNLSQIVIVDNNPFSFLLQPLNGITCVPFSAGQPYDDQVLQILPLWIEKHYHLHNFMIISTWHSLILSKAFGGSPSSTQAPFSAKRCTASLVWEIPHARMVSNARYTHQWQRRLIHNPGIHLMEVETLIRHRATQARDS